MKNSTLAKLSVPFLLLCSASVLAQDVSPKLLQMLERSNLLIPQDTLQKAINNSKHLFRTPQNVPAFTGDPVVLKTQRKMRQEGHYHGPLDGQLGPMTRRAMVESGRLRSKSKLPGFKAPGSIKKPDLTFQTHLPNLSKQVNPQPVPYRDTRRWPTLDGKLTVYKERKDGIKICNGPQCQIVDYGTIMVDKSLFDPYLGGRYGLSAEQRKLGIFTKNCTIDGNCAKVIPHGHRNKHRSRPIERYRPRIHQLPRK